MTRFRDLRRTEFKRTSKPEYSPWPPDAEPMDIPEPTVARLSPFELATQRVRKGVNGADVFRPTYNRADRRRFGYVRPRKRLPGVALINKPWHIESKETATA